MGREWGDLRKLMDLRMQCNANLCPPFMDLRMQCNANLCPPFMMVDGNYDEHNMFNLMWCIAKGVEQLHKESTLHRDLKASNIRIWGYNISDFDPVANMNDLLNCYVADFECSIGVVGTGYWRAPEILEVVKNRTWSTTPNVFTTKSDVYSYEMVCYEIITGHKPFEDIEDDGKISLNDVLEGKRPSLPRYLKPWMKELLFRCWHKDPLERPSFEEIDDF